MIEVNGEKYCWKEGMTVGFVLEMIGGKQTLESMLSGRVVTVNMRLVPPGDFGSWPLKDGDQLRILRVPGGG